MWSSLSSYLYNEPADDAGEPRPAPRRSPSKPRVAGAAKDKRINAAAAAASPRGSHGGDVGGRTISLQTSLHSTSSNGSNTKRHALPPSENTTILRGIIVGEEESGKTCLIRRLRGEDPFQSRSQHHPDNRAETKDRAGRKNLMALIPWELPQDAPFHQRSPSPEQDEPVQLYVSEGKSFSYLNEERSFHKQWLSVLHPHRGGKGYHFAVWVIDPRMENVLDYIKLGLDILFPSASRQGSGDEGDGTRAKNTNHQLVQHLCILLNFRDLNPNKPEEGQSSFLVEVQKVVEKATEQHDSGEASLPPTIMVYESSMKNCYGLQHLHSFIALPYLSQKEQELRRRAENARKEQMQWKQGLMATEVMQYSAFVEQTLVKQKRQQTKQSVEREKLEEEKKKLQLRLKKQNQLLRSKGHKAEASADVFSDTNQRRKQLARAAETTAASTAQSAKGGKEELARAPSNNNVEQRKVFPKSGQHPSTSKATPEPSIKEHHNLESFFSDDEAESVADDSGSSSDDDGSDDGDFYIDVSGTRCAHANGRPPHHNVSTAQKGKMNEKGPTLDVVPRDESDKVGTGPTALDDLEASKRRDDIAGTDSNDNSGDAAAVSSATTPIEQSSAKYDVHIGGDVREDAANKPASVDSGGSVDEPTLGGVEEEGEHGDASPERSAGHSLDSNVTKEVECDDGKKAEDDDDADAMSNANGEENGKLDEVVDETRSTSVGDEHSSTGQREEKAEHSANSVDVEIDDDHGSKNGEDQDATRTLDKSTISEEAAAGTAQKQFLAGDEGEVSDESADAANAKSEPGKGCVGAGTATDFEDAQNEEHVEEKRQSKVVMDSDDESDDHLIEESSSVRKKSKSGEDEDVLNDEATQKSHETSPAKASLPPQSDITPAATSIPVSSAALAAIEAAKKEAELMMAQAQPDIKKDRKSKKKKKKKERKVRDGS